MTGGLQESKVSKLPGWRRLPNDRSSSSRIEIVKASEIFKDYPMPAEPSKAGLLDRIEDGIKPPPLAGAKEGRILAASHLWLY